MLINTKHFGEIDLDESKIIHFPEGVLGFEELKDYTLIYDNEDGNRPDISWLQSIEEPAMAMPVISPFIIMPEYNPEVEDELLKPIGQITDENLVVLVTITVPTDVTQSTANLKAPFIINSDTRQAVQIIVENNEYEIKYRFYEILKEIKAAKGDK